MVEKRIFLSSRVSMTRSVHLSATRSSVWRTSNSFFEISEEEFIACGFGYPRVSIAPKSAFLQLVSGNIINYIWKLKIRLLL